MTPARLEVPVGKYTVVCKDGVIDVADAVGILTYYAKQASGQTPSFS